MEVMSEEKIDNMIMKLTAYGLYTGLIENSDVVYQTVYRDLFDTKLMGVMTDRPSSIMKKFNDYYIKDPVSATDYFYEFSKDTNYIRRDRIKRDVKWVTSTEYGNLDITINLSKPEKDPKTIAMALKMKNPLILCVSSAWRMRDILEELIILQEKITG